MNKKDKFILRARSRWSRDINKVDKRACLENDGIMCDLCQKGWIPGYCRVVRYRYYAHMLGKEEFKKDLLSGNAVYLKQALRLYAPWKLNEFEKLLILL